MSEWEKWDGSSPHHQQPIQTRPGTASGTIIYLFIEKSMCLVIYMLCPYFWATHLSLTYTDTCAVTTSKLAHKEQLFTVYYHGHINNN